MATWRVTIVSASNPSYSDIFTVKEGEKRNVVADGLPCEITGGGWSVDVYFSVYGGSVGSAVMPGCQTSLENRTVKVERI